MKCLYSLCNLASAEGLRPVCSLYYVGVLSFILLKILFSRFLLFFPLYSPFSSYSHLPYSSETPSLHYHVTLMNIYYRDFIRKHETCSVKLHTQECHSLNIHMFSKSVRLTTIYSGVIDTVHIARYTLPAVNVTTKMQTSLVSWAIGRYDEQGYTILPLYLFLYCFPDCSYC